MQLGLRVALLVVALVAAWALLGSPFRGADHAAHAATVAIDANAPEHAGHADGRDCCAIPGGAHCASAAGMLGEPPSAGPTAGAAAANSARNAGPLFTRNPNPPAEPPRT